MAGKITPRNILHPGKEDKITLKNLDSVSSDNVSDALKQLYGNTGLVEGIKPVCDTYKVTGRIRTVYTDSGDWGTIIKAIYESQKGEILFIKCSDETKAIWGELASVAAKEYGIKATVIYGASRDTNEIREIGYPVFSRSVRSNSGHALNEGTISEDLIVGDMIIRTGDIAVADCDGVVIIPQDKIDEVLCRVTQIKNTEKKYVKQITGKKMRFDEILGL